MEFLGLLSEKNSEDGPRENQSNQGMEKSKEYKGKLQSFLGFTNFYQRVLLRFCQRLIGNHTIN